MYRRRVFAALSGFDPRVSAACDSELHLRIARLYPVCHNNTIVVQKRLHGANQSRHSARLLESEITLLGWQLRGALSDRQALDALQDGVRFYSSFYGKPLIGQVMAELRQPRRWAHVSSGLRVLAQCAALYIAIYTCRIVRWPPFPNWLTPYSR